MMALGNAATVALSQGFAGPIPLQTRRLRVKSAAALTEANADGGVEVTH